MSEAKKSYTEIDVSKEVMASLVGRWMKDPDFRGDVQEDLNEALAKHDYLDHLTPEELEAVRDFDRKTLKKGKTEEDVDNILIEGFPHHPHKNHQSG